jgi:hypothetical protein
MDKKTPGALLYPDIGLGLGMCRIGGRQRSWGVSLSGANGEIPLLLGLGSNLPKGGDSVRWVV